ncbi:MAG: ATP-binding protein [Gemmatimonadetes bacterium]|nr:ATP-binding protein [Gemmatimonadota bacterium]
MGETRVDLLHLLEDLRDAYPGSLEETILTEILANALDSGADTVSLETAPSAALLTVVDNGRGMRRRELARYHDLAATTKLRGRGIGFAGVGIKLGLLACQEVITETVSAGKRVASAWHLKSRNRAPWRWVEPPGLVAEHGTAVRLVLSNPLSPLLDAGFVEGAIRRHFHALMDPTFDAILGEVYPRGVRFTVNGRALERLSPAADRASVAVRLPRRRKPSALGYLERVSHDLREEQAGIAISTLGKVIKRGWDWLGVSPVAPERLTGVIEAPALAECLTLNKADFIRAGQRGAMYLAFRKAIQEVVAERLAAWGDLREAEPRRRSARPIERDLETVLVDLADDFPLLAALVDARPGGQRRLPLGGAGGTAEPQLVPVAPPAEGGPATVEPGEAVAQEAGGVTEPAPAEVPQPSEPPAAAVAEAALARGGRKRPARYGLRLQFESRPGDASLSRLVESTVWVNDAHPAYRRAVASRSEGYHLALAVALALAPLAVEPAQAQLFVESFLTRWGEAAGGKKKRRR